MTPTAGKRVAPHLRLREMFSRRIRDGVLNEGEVTISEEGTPQSGIVSSLLSNLYPHEALDHWFAHDAVPCFARKEEAEQVLKELGERMTEYGLNLPPEETKLVGFRPPGRGQSKGQGSINFLGFCFYWARTRRGPAWQWC